MKIKTSELTRQALNWAVALAVGYAPPLLRVLRGRVALPRLDDPMWCDYLEYDEDWSQGGPIIERERLHLIPLVNPYHGQPWECSTLIPDVGSGVQAIGPTPLIAAMRCFVASRLGDEVDVPAELC